MSSPETPGSQAVDGAEISDDDEGSSAFGVTPLGIWGLAWPTMLAMGAGTVVRLTDFAMVGDLGPSATAAIGVGGNFYWLIESLASVPSLGLMAILARAVGAGDRALADASHRQAQLQGVVLALIGCALADFFTLAQCRRCRLASLATTQHQHQQQCHQQERQRQ